MRESGSKLDLRNLQDRLKLACNWLTEIAQVRNDAEESIDRRFHQHKTWAGAIRGEYAAATKAWSFFCPVWHTGQAVKALVSAYSVLGDQKLLDAAKLGVDFILSNQITDPSDADFGLILAYEDHPDKVTISALIECMDGLIQYAQVADETLWPRIDGAANWLLKKAYLRGEGLFLDLYHPAAGEFVPYAYGVRARPLLDDAIFLKVFRQGGREEYREVFLETAGKLLMDEDPPGNWINYGPCRKQTGCIHPRHAYWWGYPMIAAYEETGDRKYLDCAFRAGEWYRNAQRRDGGLFRETYTDFTTSSFGHATSGIACAIAMWLELDRIEPGRFIEAIEMAVEFCCGMQFVDPADANLKGAILEKVLPPDGTDNSPYYVRDLGTIFFIQALSRYLQRKN